MGSFFLTNPLWSSHGPVLVRTTHWGGGLMDVSAATENLNNKGSYLLVCTDISNDINVASIHGVFRSASLSEYLVSIETIQVKSMHRNLP